MNRIRLMLAATFALLIAVAVTTTIWWQRRQHTTGSMQRFEVRGVVRGVERDEGMLRVEHEAIPNYMPAMTMALPVKNRELLQELHAGDAITFRLEVTENDSWISQIRKTAAGSPGGANAASTGVGTNTLSSRVQTGAKVPDFTLVDQNGRARSLSDFRGKAVLLSFIYTRCPLPNFCPMLSHKFAELQQTLNTNVPGKFHLVTITIDPEHDTPEVLKQYAVAKSKDDRTWTFGTAGRKEIETIAGYFGLVHERTAGGQIDHDMRTALIDPQGRLVHIWRSNYWSREEVLQRIAEL